MDSHVMEKNKNKDSHDWTSLPTDLVHSILEKLILLEDYIRFSAVCKQWFYVGQDQKRQRLKMSINQPPMILIPDDNTFPITRSLYNIIQRKTYVNSLVKYDYIFLGSSFGWVATISDDLAIKLINPFSEKTIELPPISKVVPYVNPQVFLPDDDDPYMQYYTRNLEDWRSIPRIFKVILSDNPDLNPDNYIVVAIVYMFCTLAFMKSGDVTWTYLDQKILFLEDILFYKGQLYAVDYKDGLTKINDLDKASNSLSDVEVLIPKANNVLIFKRYFLVESVDGELLLVKKFLWREMCEGKLYTKRFQIFKLGTVKDGQKERLGWVQTESLGNQTLFLGINSSISVLANDFSPHIKRNSIYYTDTRIRPTIGRYDDVGIFSLEDQSFDSYYKEYRAAHKLFLPAIWISPSLQ